MKAPTVKKLETQPLPLNRPSQTTTLDQGIRDEARDVEARVIARHIAEQKRRSLG